MSADHPQTLREIETICEYQPPQRGLRPRKMNLGKPEQPLASNAERGIDIDDLFPPKRELEQAA